MAKLKHLGLTDAATCMANDCSKLGNSLQHVPIDISDPANAANAQIDSDFTAVVSR
jgi:hypothetical protein